MITFMITRGRYGGTRIREGHECASTSTFLDELVDQDDGMKQISSRQFPDRLLITTLATREYPASPFFHHQSRSAVSYCPGVYLREQ